MNTFVRRWLSASVVWSVMSVVALAQSPQMPASDVTARSIKAIGYQVGSGDTTVDLKGTALGAGAVGEAKVEAKSAVTMVEAAIKGLRPPTQVGTEFLAYVLWAVSPEGRAVNLGEVRPNNDGRGGLKATTQLQSFSLFVTAEPYPGVRQPSEMVILENDVRKNTKGRLFIVDDYKLMKRSQYQKLANPLALSLDLKKAPLEMYQARNAVDIARSRGAEKYAPEIFSKAQGGLELAENALVRKANTREVLSYARQAMQASEDARALTAERMEAERVAGERAAAAAQAKSAAEAKAATEAACGSGSEVAGGARRGPRRTAQGRSRGQAGRRGTSGRATQISRRGAGSAVEDRGGGKGSPVAGGSGGGARGGGEGRGGGRRQGSQRESGGRARAPGCRRIAGAVARSVQSHS
jgi:hypothetical protein